MDHKEVVKSGYNKVAGRYLAERRRNSADIRLLNDFIELLSPKSRALDAGCGAGVPVAQILTKHFDVIGVDFSETQIELARKNVPTAKFICADMSRLGLTTGSLDGICSYYAIIHIPREEHGKLFVDFYRILKTGGIALLCLGADDLADVIEEDYLGTRMYWSHYNSDTSLKMLKDCGFSVIWAKRVEDEMYEGAYHLFTLVQKGVK